MVFFSEFIRFKTEITNYKLKTNNINNNLKKKEEKNRKMGKINYLKVRNSKCRAKPYRTDKKQKVFLKKKKP